MSKLFPGISKATIEICYDNGIINRATSKTHILNKLIYVLKECPYQNDELILIDIWLNELSQNQLQLVCCGETREMVDTLSSAPPKTEGLLNYIFNNI